MKRTTKLMAGVTASILLTGTQSTGVAAPGAPQKAEKQNESWKTDPEVLKDANEVYGWLKGIDEEKAKTADEVSREFPKLTPARIELALKNLVYRGLADRTGTGSADNPYLYFKARGKEG